MGVKISHSKKYWSKQLTIGIFLSPLTLQYLQHKTEAGHCYLDRILLDEKVIRLTCLSFVCVIGIQIFSGMFKI